MIQTKQQEWAWKARSEKERALLKAYGYRWCKDGDTWILYASGGSEIEKRIALQEIATLQKPKPWHEVVRWSRELKNAVFLDTETTGVGNTDEIIDLAVVDMSGQVLINTLIQCQCDAIPARVRDVHHIEKSMLQDAPMFANIWPDLERVLAEMELVIYNADFDLRMIKQMAERYGLSMPVTQSHCLMKKYSQYCGCTRNLRLDAARLHFNIKSKGSHRALADAEDSRRVLQGLGNVGSINGCVQESFCW